MPLKKPSKKNKKPTSRNFKQTTKQILSEKMAFENLLRVCRKIILAKEGS
jgi:hypothetical protein